MKLTYNSAYIQTKTFTSPPKVICEELHSHPSHKEWTHPLDVVLAAHSSPQTSQSLSYIHTAVPHASYTLVLHCDVQFPPPKNYALSVGAIHPHQKKILLLPT